MKCLPGGPTFLQQQRKDEGQLDVARPHLGCDLRLNVTHLGSGRLPTSARWEHAKDPATIMCKRSCSRSTNMQKALWAIGITF
jgi:hypothetical protein